MSQRSLWGEIPSQTERRTPRSILEEQARILTEATNKVLRGHVRFVNNDSSAAIAQGLNFVIRMYIVAPLLDDYQYEVLQVRHGIKLFPAEIKWERSSIGSTVKGEEEFVSAVEKILSSDSIHEIITALLAQSGDVTEVSV